LPREPRFFIDNPDHCRDSVDEEWDNGEEAYQARLEEHRLAFPVGDFYLDEKEFTSLVESGRRVEAEQLEVARETSPSVRMKGEPHRELAIELARARAEKHEELLRPLVERLRDWRDEGTRAIVVVPNSQHAERLESLLRGYQIVPVAARGEIDLFDPKAQ